MVTEVVKRDGRKEPFSAEKLVNWAEWASVYGCDWSGIVRDAFNKLPESCSTKDLHDALIKACIDREDEPHVLMAGRLYMGAVYKQCFGDINCVPPLSEFYSDMVALGYWADMGYEPEELDEYDKLLDHGRDLELSYPQAKQIVGKYSVKNRTTKQLFETPQFSYMRMALGSSYKDPIEVRKMDVPNFFRQFSGPINCPTPDWSNLGTNNKGTASCCLYTAGDSIDSLAASMHIGFKMTAASAGLGNMILSRSAGDPIRGGIVKHNGKLPYLRLDQEIARANMQGARAGALTTSICCLDPEIFDLVSARNPKTAEAKRVAAIDYSFSVNQSFVERVSNNEDWMLISYYYAPDLWEAFFDKDNVRFEELYEKYLKDESVPKKIIKALDLVVLHVQNQQEIGRQYETFITEINRHTPLNETIHHSNLCQEILEHTRPYKGIWELYENKETSGEIALCTLASVVPDKVGLDVGVDGKFTEETLKRYEETCYYALKKIDNAIENMEYPFPNLAYTAKRRRYAGVGITGLAYEMALKGHKYTSASGKRYMHMLAELHMFSLIKASLRLARERGVCEWMCRTKWVDGWLPIDTYNRAADIGVDATLNLDWEGLRKELIENKGHRFSLLCAYMPTESSSIASNRPNSLYPIREHILIKGDGEDAKIFIAPETARLSGDYEKAWDITPVQMIDVYAIWQKFCDQGISADIWMGRTNLEKVTARFSALDMVSDWLYAKHKGVKSRYYSNTKNSGDRIEGKEHVEDTTACVGGACEV